jgi:hypothetical protein
VKRGEFLLAVRRIPALPSLQAGDQPIVVRKQPTFLSVSEPTRSTTSIEGSTPRLSWPTICSIRSKNWYALFHLTGEDVIFIFIRRLPIRQIIVQHLSADLK